jgi:hypothetical protein
MSTVDSRTPFLPTHPVALAVYCSDGRFTGAVEELLASLGHERIDTLTMPGGPALLDLSSAMPSDRDAVGRAVRFLVHGHALTEVVLVAHEGCGYYRARHPTRSADEIRALQLADLKKAAGVLRIEHPKLEVVAYLAQVVDGHVRFAPVAT